MSAQTIIHPSAISMREQAEDTFIKNADKYLFKRMYGLGEGYCNFEQQDSTIIYDIIQSNDCELLSLIQKELEETETSVEIRTGYSEHIIENAEDNLYELWLSQGYSGSKRDFLNQALVDEKANWDEIKW